MTTQSCLYDCEVMHHRLGENPHRFSYQIFMFYLDLDEIQTLAKRLWWVSHNRWNLFSFWDADHLGDQKLSTKENLLTYVRSKGFAKPIHRIRLLTHLRTLGYIFNPVSFYFCFDEQDQPLCSVVEVGNTFREMKPYFLGADTWKADAFQATITKYFYVSPFIDLDASFDFNLHVPGKRLQLVIDDSRNKKKFFLSALTGQRVPLTNSAIVWRMIRFPFITLQVIFLIHWQAFKLWGLKQIPYHKKAANPDLQKEVQRAYKSS